MNKEPLEIFINSFDMESLYLQDITDNSHRPHVCTKTNLIKVNYFGGYKFWSTKQNLKFLIRVVLSC